MDTDAVIKVVQAIWQPCGISLTVGTLQRDEFTFFKAGRVNIATPGNKVNDELKTLLSGENFIPNTLNVYFVHENYDYLEPNRSHTTGITFDPTHAKKLSINQGILVQTKRHDTFSLAKILAHEIGHFFRLKHVYKRDSDNPRVDTWANRMLMYPFDDIPRANWTNDVGYGVGQRGCLITLKDLTDLKEPTKNHITDPEWISVRSIIHSKLEYIPVVDP